MLGIEAYDRHTMVCYLDIFHGQFTFQLHLQALQGHSRLAGNLIIVFFFFFLIYLFVYLFLAVLGLRFCARAFSNCGKRGPLFITVWASHYRGLSCCGAQAPDAQAQ